jgi:uncharacterized linocin/CFP29 family protein
VVDVAGPHGLEYGVVDLGRLELASEPVGGVHYGIRTALPLVEVRVPFRLSHRELDNISRGAKDPDFEPMEEAASAVAMFEERALYRGFAPGSIAGLTENGAHEPVVIDPEVKALPGAVMQARRQIEMSGISGPFALVMGPEVFTFLAQERSTCTPVYRQLRDQVDRDLTWSAALKNQAVLLSLRGGDFEMVLGQDLTIGYVDFDRNADEVEFYFTESFTFRVLEPAAAITLQLAG